MHIGLDIPSKPSGSGSGSGSGEVEIRRKSKRKQPAATSTPRESSTSPPRAASSSSSSSAHGHAHGGAPTISSGHDHSHGHTHGHNNNRGHNHDSGTDSGHSSDDEGASTIVSAAPSTSRLVDLEDNTDIISSLPSIGGAGSSSSSSSSTPSSLTNGPAAGLIAVNMDDIRRQCGSIATNLSLSITPIIAAIRRAPSSLKHTRADDPLFGRDDREIPLSFLGDRQMAARSQPASADAHVHTSIMDSVDVHSYDLDDDFM